MASFDVIEEEEDPYDLEHPSSSTFVPEPIVIKGIGNVTVFGLSSRFEAEFPSQLTGRVAPEEFRSSLARLNRVLRNTMPINLRWLFCGCLFCCCTLGCSLWPVVCLSKRTKKSLEKALDWENTHLYSKLGMQLRLARRKCDSSNMTEYVILMEQLPKAPLLQPD